MGSLDQALQRSSPTNNPSVRIGPWFGAPPRPHRRQAGQQKAGLLAFQREQRQVPRRDEWRLHPDIVRLIWQRFGPAQGGGGVWSPERTPTTGGGSLSAVRIVPHWGETNGSLGVAAGCLVLFWSGSERRWTRRAVQLCGARNSAPAPSVGTGVGVF